MTDFPKCVLDIFCPLCDARIEEAMDKTEEGRSRTSFNFTRGAVSFCNQAHRKRERRERERERERRGERDANDRIVLRPLPLCLSLSVSHKDNSFSSMSLTLFPLSLSALSFSFPVLLHEDDFFFCLKRGHHDSVRPHERA